MLTRERAPHGRVLNHGKLLRVLWVELQHCACTANEAVVERLKEYVESVFGIVLLLVGIAKPLQCGYTVVEKQ